MKSAKHYVRAIPVASFNTNTTSVVECKWLLQAYPNPTFDHPYRNIIPIWENSLVTYVLIDDGDDEGWYLASASVALLQPSQSKVYVPYTENIRSILHEFSWSPFAVLYVRIDGEPAMNNRGRSEGGHHV